MRTLLLTFGYEPVRAISWQRAVMLLYLEKAEVVADYTGRALHSPRIVMAMPAVIRLRHFIRPSRRVRVPFSRRNIYLRDEWTCQYCGDRPAIRQLTLDHVMPRSRGGPTSWTNVVTACRGCNSTKASRTPIEAGMALKVRPARPTAMPWQPPSMAYPSAPEEWAPFLAPYQASSQRRIAAGCDRGVGGVAPPKDI